MNSSRNLIVFDCDSTLSAIEGVDELGGLKDPKIKMEVEDLTHQAMAGKISIESIFKKRMDLIRPSESDCNVVGEKYIEAVEPNAKSVIHTLQSCGWRVVILSGGFASAIHPLAKFLKIDHVEAVPLYFDTDGNYLGFDENYPTTRNGGKPEIVKILKETYRPEKIVMVGDGVSDLETRSVVDLFVGFGRYAVRERVKNEADVFITSLADLLGHLPA